MTSVALCYCGEPLVGTMAFRKFEFYCVRCGRHYGWLDPRPAAETPALLARIEEDDAEWERLADGLIADGGMRLDDCATCKSLHQPHLVHATPAELEADRVARDRIAQAVTR